jgi:tight adherence protein B
MVSLLASLVSALAVGMLALAVSKAHTVRPRRGERPASSVDGLDVTNTQFWLAVSGVAVITFALVYGLTRLIVVSAVPAMVVATLPRAFFSRARARRIRMVQEAWPDGLREILSSVRSGASLPTALESLAVFGPPPLREAFQGFGIYSRSLGVVPALETIRQDLADPTSDRVIEVLVVAYERGGSVVPEILTDLAEATTRDLWTMEEIRTETLEHKINARVVFVLPWLVLVAMTTRSGAFRDFYSTTAGILVALVGGVMSLTGIVIASRLGVIPAEPRVFGGSR